MRRDHPVDATGGGRNSAIGLIETSGVGEGPGAPGATRSELVARLCEPASELHIAEDWYRRTALAVVTVPVMLTDGVPDWRRPRIAVLEPPGTKFIAAVSTSPRPGSDIREGFFISPSQNKDWKWVLWKFSYDDNYETWSWLIRATSNRIFANSTEAAEFLLTAVWAWEREQWDRTIFEEVEDSGLISEKRVWEIDRPAFRAKRA